MVTRNEIKQIASLRQQKFRNELGLFVVEGRKMTEELLRSDFETVGLYATEAFLANHPAGFNEAKTISEVQMAQISRQDTPPGILAVVKIPVRQTLSNHPRFILALDGIANPGNMGTLIRTAEWFGISDIVCSPDCVEVWNPKVIQATMGSIFRINVLETDLTTFLPQQIHEGKAVFGALLEGQNLFETGSQKGGIIVIGSESHGIRSEVLPYITHAVTIPRVNNSATESLNASIAAGIIIAELTRQA